MDTTVSYKLFIFVSVSIAANGDIFFSKERKKKYETSNVLSIIKQQIYSNNKNFSLVFHSYTLCNFHFIDRLLFLSHFISSFGGTFNDNDSTEHDVGKMSLHWPHVSFQLKICERML